jgi:putative tricarboxylic transport membrane protein
MKLSDRITGLFLALLGLATYIGGAQLPPVPGQQVGPSAFPIVIGAGLMLVGVLIALGVGRGFEAAAEAELARHGEPDLEAGRYAASRKWYALLPPGLLVFYYFTSETIGFVPVAAIMIGVLAFALNAGRRQILPVAIIGAVMIQIVFVKVLRVPLPPGLLPMPW